MEGTSVLAEKEGKRKGSEGQMDRRGVCVCVWRRVGG